MQLREKSAFATRIAFFAAGFGVSCWAPLVPYAKMRLGVNEASLGLLLLCLGAGSVIAMPIVGTLSTRFGSKPLVIAGGVGVAAMLPLLSFLTTLTGMAAALVVFGASLGSLDVAMNLHAVEVEHLALRPMMSGFHALYSVGGFVGSGFMTAILSCHVSPILSATSGAAVVLMLMFAALPILLHTRSDESSPAFVLPRGPVLLLAALALVSFLVEGALLDWSALFLVTTRLMQPSRGGIGFMLFSIAMTVARLTGDRIIAKIGELRTLVVGGVTTLLGFISLLTAPHAAFALLGFILIGLGAANVVPILFRRAGNQQYMPPGLALAAVSTAGYAGVLAGPALIGFVAHASSLRFALAILAVLFSSVILFSKRATRL